MEELQMKLEMAHHHAVLGAEAILEFQNLLNLRDFLLELSMNSEEDLLSLYKEEFNVRHN